VVEAEKMDTGYASVAEALIFVHGLKAEAEAAMHAQLCEKWGDWRTADTWRKVEATIRAGNMKKAA
jgi:hypothetical protein